VPELRELFGLDRLPIAQTDVTVELGGVPTAVVNALRRTLVDEMPGYALAAGDAAETRAAYAETTDVYMLPEFCEGRINSIPLVQQLAPELVRDLRFDIDVENQTQAPIVVRSGDMRAVAGRLGRPIFNPTFVIAEVQPGKRFAVRGIRVVRGLGRENAMFNVARRAAYAHLDLPEHPRAETHGPAAARADESGYAVSCLVADPRRHRLRFTLAATSESPDEPVVTVTDACDVLIQRLRRAAGAVAAWVAEDHRQGGAKEKREGRRAPAAAHRREKAARTAEAPGGARFAVVDLGDDRRNTEGGPTGGALQEGRLILEGETHTIGEMLKRTVYEIEPRVAFLEYRCDTRLAAVVLTVRLGGDAARLVADAVARCEATFETIKRDVLRTARR
jgi:DNA-directed RNA polymerase subunit L